MITIAKSSKCKALDVINPPEQESVTRSGITRPAHWRDDLRRGSKLFPGRLPLGLVERSMAPGNTVHLCQLA
jgi:hypothetical protein